MLPWPFDLGHLTSFPWAVHIGSRQQEVDSCLLFHLVAWLLGSIPIRSFSN